MHRNAPAPSLQRSICASALETGEGYWGQYFSPGGIPARHKRIIFLRRTNHWNKLPREAEDSCNSELHAGFLGQTTKTSRFLEKGSQVTLVCPKLTGLCFGTSLEQLPIHAAPVGAAHRRSRGIPPFQPALAGQLITFYSSELSCVHLLLK